MESRVKREIYLFDPKGKATTSKTKAIRHVPGHEHYIIFDTIDGILARVNAFIPNLPEAVFTRLWDATGEMTFTTKRTRKNAIYFDVDWPELYRRRHG